jgi:hypothetical protein
VRTGGACPSDVNRIRPVAISGYDEEGECLTGKLLATSY